jgi:DNA modification methylase
MVFTDSPYNVPIRGHVTKRANVREFMMASGEMSPDEFIAFLRDISSLVADNVRGGAVMYYCIDWAHYTDLLHATHRILGQPKNLVVWAKDNAGMGSFYRSQHELIPVFVAPGAAPTNNFGLGARRYRTNVWQYPGVNTLGTERDATLAMHPTVKPVALVADAIRDCSHRGEIILDPFGGSGTTMIAAQKTGRHARLMEIDPLYCDVILRRFEAFTGDQPVLAETGETFSQAKEIRGTIEVAK